MIKRKILVLLQTLCLGILFSVQVFSQTAENDKTVFFRVTAVNDKREVQKELKKENFKVKEGKTEKEISYFSDQEEPAGVTILLDVSDSMDLNRKQSAANTALKFIQGANEQNDYSIITFGKKIKKISDWGSTDDEIVKTLIEAGNTKEKNGATSFFDAVSVAIESFSGSKYEKRVLLILSDGVDNNSKIRFEKLEKQLKFSDVQVYSISITGLDDFGSPTGRQGQANLEGIASATGGISFYPQTRRELDDFLVILIQAIKFQYKIGFEGQKPFRKDDWRSFEIKAESDADEKGKKKKLKVFTKQGYYADQPNK